MAPKSSFTGIWKYPTNRDSPKKSFVTWLDGRRQDDGAEGLWRIHDQLYDFSSYVDVHPGGSEWLQLTKGTDITEAFIVHHLTTLPASLLDNYKVRAATTVRNSSYTFEADGFYQVIRSKVLRKFPARILKGPTLQSKLVCDALAVAFSATALLSAYKQNTTLAVLSGLLLGMLMCAAHNFLHMRNHWRRHYISLTTMTAKSFRVIHTLSHHLYPNSVMDLEVSLAEPWLPWLPDPDQNLLSRYGSWVTSPIVAVIVFPVDYVRRVVTHGFDPRSDLLPWVVPLLMAAVNPAGALLWPLIFMASSFFFTLTGASTGHHHPEAVHDGDAVRKDRDWGLAQLDSVVDRGEVSGVTVEADGQIRSSDAWWYDVLVMCNFGHHTLHHLFPTVDHAHLRQMYPILQETLAEFGLKYRVESLGEQFRGQFRQLARNQPNLTPPELRPKKHI